MGVAAPRAPVVGRGPEPPQKYKTLVQNRYLPTKLKVYLFRQLHVYTSSKRNLRPGKQYLAACGLWN